MKGIRIHSKGGGSRHKIDYGFCELVKPITEHLGGLYWILSGVVLDGSSNLDEFENTLPRYDESEAGQFRIMKPAFLSECCKWINGDWSRIYGVADIQPYIALKDVDESNLLQNSIVAFRCVDAAYWEIFAKNAEVIEVLRTVLPNSSDIKLAN